MKKILLAFAFLPMLSFAQDVNESPRKGIFDSSVIKESNDPAVFVDGERVDKSVFTKMNPDDLKESTTKIGLGFGVEKHFAGTDRLSPYVGGDLLVGFNSSKVEQGSYEEKGPNGFRLGVRGVFGADYYFAKNLYLGVEAGLGIFYHNTGKTEINGTTVNDGSNRFEITPSVVGGVRVGFIMF